MRPDYAFLGALSLAAAIMAGVLAYRSVQRNSTDAQAQAVAAAQALQAQADIDPGFAVADFSLTASDGQPLTRRDLDGQIWIASFFFSTCPGPCFQLNRTVAELTKEYGPKGVVFVSISVDPENDTPAVLAKYAEKFDADHQSWKLLTGPWEDVHKLATNSFHVSAGSRVDDPAVPHEVSHSDRLLLVDRTGKVRGTYPATDSARVEMLHRRLNRLLEEQP